MTPREPLDPDFPDVDAVLEDIEAGEESAEYTKGTELALGADEELEEDGESASGLDDDLDFA